MMRDKSIIAQESLKGSILSFYMKLERQMGNVCTAVHTKASGTLSETQGGMQLQASTVTAAPLDTPAPFPYQP